MLVISRIIRSILIIKSIVSKISTLVIMIVLILELLTIINKILRLIGHRKLIIIIDSYISKAKTSSIGFFNSICYRI